VLNTRASRVLGQRFLKFVGQDFAVVTLGSIRLDAMKTSKTVLPNLDEGREVHRKTKKPMCVLRP